jgi:hypothetical protein
MRELNAVLPNGIADPLNANIRSWCGWFPYAAFRRAIEARNLTRALTEARDLPRISLVDAAELVVLAAEQHGPFVRAMVRTLGRPVCPRGGQRHTRRGTTRAPRPHWSQAGRPTSVRAYAHRGLRVPRAA